MRQLHRLSISYKNAGIDLIELARSRDADRAVLDLMTLDDVSEAMLLQTCNRVELYAVAEDGAILQEYAGKKGMPVDAMILSSGDECMAGLLRLACGLESMIVGEDQILGQLKASYLQAEKLGAAGPVLSTTVLKAIGAGKRARQETRINRGAVSVGSAAVDLAESILGDLQGRTILVVGAGEMGTLVANAIAEKGLRAIYVANRTFEQAEKLASSLRGTAVRLEHIGSYIGSADVIICATGAPHVIVTKRMVEQHKGSGKLLIIDITNPRNVEASVGEVPGVTLHNIDSLRRISEANLELRRQEAAKVEAIIGEEMKRLQRDLKRLQADRAIGMLYRKTDHIRLTELEHAIARLSSAGGLSEKQVGILQDFSSALASKILASPTVRLRLAAERSDEACLRAAQELFDLKPEEDNVVPNHKTKALKTE